MGRMLTLTWHPAQATEMAVMVALISKIAALNAMETSVKAWTEVPSLRVR